MPKLKILADGNSTQAKANARGHLFEDLMSEVLRNYGYEIKDKSNVNYSGMEIDIEGESILHKTKLYAECKCYDKVIDSPKFQAFFGKYMAKWRKDSSCHGLFIAIPEINSYARGFFNDNCQDIIQVLEENDVIESIVNLNLVKNHNVIISFFDNTDYEPGDCSLLYTDKGLFWEQLLIPKGSAIPTFISIFNSEGQQITDSVTISYLKNLEPDIGNFTLLENPNDEVSAKHKFEFDNDDQIVEVRGGSECFEYQFPASPEYFVGRKENLSEINQFVSKIIAKSTSSRGILFEGNSGWGKSSLVLASVDSLLNQGHYAVSIDSRSASSPQFIIKVVDYVFKKFDDFDGMASESIRDSKISGFEGAVNKLLEIGKVLQENEKVLVIFLDQFENVFFKENILKKIHDLYLKTVDRESNIILGFSWKTDLFGSTSEFPYHIRDSIKNTSKRITLETFSEEETSEIFERLERELKPKRILSKDLKFFLSDFSQGYPWTLKKLCSHVKSQIEKGLSQSEISTSLLNIKDLFKEDLNGLSAEELETIKKIAKNAPIDVQEFSNEDYKPEIVQSLVNARLIVKIGSKYDVYWDIFRDYLNTGHVPYEENYLLRTTPGSILKAVKILNTHKEMEIKMFIAEANLTQKTFYNIIKDMKLLGLATVEGESIKLDIPSISSITDEEIISVFKSIIREKLQYNRLVKHISDELEKTESMSIDDASSLISDSCPYIVANKNTWDFYSKCLLNWMDVADFGIYDNKNKILSFYQKGKEIRKDNLSLPTRRGGVKLPTIQYSPIESVAVEIYTASKESRNINSSLFKKSTFQKTVAALEDLGFIKRKARSIELKPKLTIFVENSDKRNGIFAESIMSMNSFRIFLDIIDENPENSITFKKLGDLFKQRLNANWAPSTQKYYTRIALNWARNSGKITNNYLLVHRKRDDSAPD